MTALPTAVSLSLSLYCSSEGVQSSDLPCPFVCSSMHLHLLGIAPLWASLWASLQQLVGQLPTVVGTWEGRGAWEGRGIWGAAMRTGAVAHVTT